MTCAHLDADITRLVTAAVDLLDGSIADPPPGTCPTCLSTAVFLVGSDKAGLAPYLAAAFQL